MTTAVCFTPSNLSAAAEHDCSVNQLQQGALQGALLLEATLGVNNSNHDYSLKKDPRGWQHEAKAVSREGGPASHPGRSRGPPPPVDLASQRHCSARSRPETHAYCSAMLLAGWHGLAARNAAVHDASVDRLERARSERLSRSPG